MMFILGHRILARALQLFLVTKFTASTIDGGCTFEELCNDTSCYSCSKLADINGEELRTLDKAVGRLISHTKDLLSQIAKRGFVHSFYIGRTYIPKLERSKFSRLRSNTWKKTGISSRWDDHKSNKHGMFVLAAISRESLPPKCRAKRNQKDYALAIEQRLIHHFMFDKPDDRLQNETIAIGEKSEARHPAYAIYIAFALEEFDSE